MPIPASTRPTRRCSTIRRRRNTLGGRRPARASGRSAGAATGELGIFIYRTFFVRTFFVSWSRAASVKATDVPRAVDPAACILLDRSSPAPGGATHDDQQTGSLDHSGSGSRARAGRMREPQRARGRRNPDTGGGAGPRTTRDAGGGAGTGAAA